MMNFICFLVFVIFVGVFGLIVWGKIPRMYLSVFGAVCMIALGVFDIQEAIDFVNWETIGFLLGIFILIEILSEAGFFRLVALALAKKINYQPLMILIFFPLLCFVLSAFIDSITVMAFLAVITLELSSLLKFDPLPVIVSEVVLSNIGGASTLVGDPPNVILGTILGFGFKDFFIHNAPVAILSGLSAIAVSYAMNRKVFKALPSAIDLRGIKNIEPHAQIKDSYLLKCGLIGMAFVLSFLIARPLFNKIGMHIYVSTASLLPSFAILTFGGSRVYIHRFVRRIDADTIMFFIGLFILIGALEKTYIIQMATNFIVSLHETTAGFISSIFWGSGIISAFVDNVPLVMAMSSIIKQSMAHQVVPAMGILVWATSLGVDLGGNLTPVGASANVVAYSALEKNGVKMNWLRWLKFALPQGLIALLVGYLGILFKLKIKFF